MNGKQFEGSKEVTISQLNANILHIMAHVEVILNTQAELLSASNGKPVSENLKALHDQAQSTAASIYNSLPPFKV